MSHQTSRARLGLSALPLLLLLFPLTMGLKECDKKCTVDDVVYAAGERFEANDGCNTCLCSDSGKVSCTEIACEPDNSLPSGAGNCGGQLGLTCAADEFCNYPEDAFCGAADGLGSCAPVPEYCTEEYSPVCGCDGSTYGNVCVTHAAGVSVAHDGACAGSGNSDQDVNGGGTNSGNESLGNTGEYTNDGSGSGSGSSSDGANGGSTETVICVDRGSRYEEGDSFRSDDGCNTCTCVANGTISCTQLTCFTGENGAETCGGLQGESCADGMFCDYPPGGFCGSADGMGTCTEIPQACTEIYAPVCGCDGNTYSSECTANLAGVSVASSGECEDEEDSSDPAKIRSCGGMTGKSCNDGEFCNYPVSAICGAADAPGTCAEIPTVCTYDYTPVCGCDGNTYSNECMAQGASVSVASRGECPEDEDETGGDDASQGDVNEGDVNEGDASQGNDEDLPLPGGEDPADGVACGGLAGLSCGADQFCNYPESAICGAADATGSCMAIPEACTAEYDPVCGCDGITYGNACNAAGQGVSVAYQGECQ